MFFSSFFSPQSTVSTNSSPRKKRVSRRRRARVETRSLSRDPPPSFISLKRIPALTPTGTTRARRVCRAPARSLERESLCPFRTHARKGRSFFLSHSRALVEFRQSCRRPCGSTLSRDAAFSRRNVSLRASKSLLLETSFLGHRVDFSSVLEYRHRTRALSSSLELFDIVSKSWRWKRGLCEMAGPTASRSRRAAPCSTWSPHERRRPLSFAATRRPQTLLRDLGALELFGRGRTSKCLFLLLGVCGDRNPPPPCPSQALCDAVLEVDAERRTVRVECGARVDQAL